MDITAPIWSGHIQRNPDGSYSGELVDSWGWVVSLTAELEDYEGGKRFRLTGDVRGDRIPKGLRVPEIDDAVTFNPDTDRLGA